MNRWVVFDAPTADAVQHPDREIELRHDGAVSDALNQAVQAQRPVVLVLPADGEQATIARVTPPERP
jgi:hypothetical protein